MIDVSILIVHYNTPRLLRQTLKGIKKSFPKIAYEVIVVDNNPAMRVAEMMRREFPEVKIVMSGRNLGFGGGMNAAMQSAQGRYWFVFNPDIVLFPGALEELTTFMDAHIDVGMVGPQLKHPDGSLQFSCYRFETPEVIFYRRLPFLSRFSFAKRAVQDYLMADWDHTQTRNVDYLLGAALFVRREAVEKVGGFDPGFFVYFEDQDWCRRFWKAGWRVVYHPGASMVHYHRRETAAGSFWRQIWNPLTRVQMKSAIYYFRKYRGESNPRLALAEQSKAHGS